MSCTEPPSARNDSRACSTVATPSSVRRAPSSTTSTALAVSVWISPISPAIAPGADQPGARPGGGLALLGQLADLLGHHGEAAALLTGARGLDRRVQRQQIRLLRGPRDCRDDPPPPLRLSPPPPD